MTTQAADLRYIASRHTGLQIAAIMTDALYHKAWHSKSVTWSNRPFDKWPIVECADPMAWVDAQTKARNDIIDADREAARLATVEKAAMFMQAAA